MEVLSIFKSTRASLIDRRSLRNGPWSRRRQSSSVTKKRFGQKGRSKQSAQAGCRSTEFSNSIGWSFVKKLGMTELRLRLLGSKADMSVDGGTS